MKTALAIILAASIGFAPAAIAKDKAQPAQPTAYVSTLEETPESIAYDYSKDDLTKVTLADDMVELAALNERLISAKVWSEMRHRPRVFIRGEEDQAQRYKAAGEAAEVAVHAYEARIAALTVRIESRKALVAAK